MGGLGSFLLLIQLNLQAQGVDIHPCLNGTINLTNPLNGSIKVSGLLGGSLSLTRPSKAAMAVSPSYQAHIDVCRC